MDQFTCRPAFAAVLLSLCLTACGGGSGAADSVTPPADAGTTTTIQGVTTPSSVSVVTAKNAQ